MDYFLDLQLFFRNGAHLQLLTAVVMLLVLDSLSIPKTCPYLVINKNIYIPFGIVNGKEATAVDVVLDKTSNVYSLPAEISASLTKSPLSLTTEMSACQVTTCKIPIAF